MTETQPAPAGSGVSADVAELDRALTRISYLLTRSRRNGLTTTAAGVPLDRAAVTVLLELAGSGAMRPGELAARLEVEAPHVTRQVQRLEKAGYAARGADPDDRRAQLIQLTPSGIAAAGRIREVGRSGMQAALAHWVPGHAAPVRHPVQPHARRLPGLRRRARTRPAMTRRSPRTDPYPEPVRR